MNVSHMIERLEDAIQVCYDVGKDKKQRLSLCDWLCTGYNERNYMAIKGDNE